MLKAPNRLPPPGRAVVPAGTKVNGSLYLRSDLSTLPLFPGGNYQLTFDYRILVAPDRGFETIFYSPTAGAQGDFLPGTLWVTSPSLWAILVPIHRSPWRNRPRGLIAPSTIKQNCGTDELFPQKSEVDPVFRTGS